MEKFYLNWHKRPYKNIDMFIIGVCDIINGFIIVVTLGFWSANVHTRYVMWRTKKMWEVRERLESK